MKQRLVTLVVWLCSFLLTAAILAGCAGSVTTVTTTVTTPVTEKAAGPPCPVGAAYMGCSMGASPAFSATPPATQPKASLVPSGVKFPDVSNYQGCSINWGAVGAPGAVVKLGESNDYVDACAAHNLAGLQAARRVAMVYWFVRPVGVASQAAEIVRTLKRFHYTVSHVVDYTSPGTWAGGPGLKALWIASYSGGLHPPAPPYSPAAIKGWQYTDHGYVAGLGYGDLSVDYGMLTYGSHTLVEDTEVPGLAGYAQPIAAYVLKHDGVTKTINYSIFPSTTFKIDGRRLNERAIVKAFDHKHTAALRADLRLLAGRISHVAHFQPNGRRRKKPNWGDGRGPRYQLITHRAHV